MPGCVEVPRQLRPGQHADDSLRTVVLPEVVYVPLWLLHPEKPESLPAAVNSAVIPALDRSTGPNFASCHVWPGVVSDMTVVARPSTMSDHLLTGSPLR